tara:strand:- start:35 stop:232 length:198 start_codon:yes stop_codon:yes gene_type:complete
LVVKQQTYKFNGGLNMDEVCGCGRSPTGKCIDWHDLSEEQYQLSLKEYNARNKNNIEDKDNNVKE